MTDKTIGACRDAYNAARKPVEIEAWALTYGLWLLDLAEDGARLRADGDLPDTAAEGEIVLPEPDEYGNYSWPDNSRLCKQTTGRYGAILPGGAWILEEGSDFYTKFFSTPHAAARALAALGKGPGAKEVRHG